MSALPVRLDRGARDPLGAQLSAQVRDLVSRGTLRRGDRLPSTRALAADLGVGPEAMAAVGDGPNDLGMFAHVGTAVAMANASDAVKAAATWVTASNREDGLALAIDRLLG